MKKLGVKKLIILALVVVSAITCFGAVAIAFNNNNGINDTESEQYVDIGLDYEDGWYLIKDAEDYYTMTSVVNSGMGQDYKYRLENDVTVGSSAGMNVFSGSFDGNGHTVNLDLDYEEDVNARYSTNSGYVVLSNNTFSLTNLTYTSTLNSGVTVTGMSLLNWSNYHTNVGGEFPEEPKKTKGNVAWKGGDITLTFNSEDGYSGAFGVSKGAYAVGGMFGVLEGATVTNIRFEYISDFKWRGGHNSGQINFFGGLVGLAYQSKISNCIVKRSCDTLEYEDGGCYANIGGIAGRITNNGDYFSEGKITGPNYGISSSIYNCIVIDSNSHYSNYGCITAYGGDNVTTDFFAVAKSNIPIEYCEYVPEDMANYQQQWKGAEGYGSVSSGGTVAFTWEEYLDSSCEWVCISNNGYGGEIVQKCYAEAPTVTITFNANGGACSTRSMEISIGTIQQSGKSIPTATRNGYSFDGWYFDTNWIDKLTTYMIISEDITVYAKWEVDKYTVTLHAYTQDYSVNDYKYGDNCFDIDKTTDELYGLWNFTDDYTATYQYLQVAGVRIGRLPYVIGEESGFEVFGWWDPSSGNKVTSETEVTGDMDIYYIWEPINYTITYDYQGGSRKTGSATTWEYSILTEDIYLPSVERGDCVFLGWRCTSVSTDNKSWSVSGYYNAGSFENSGYAGDVTLTAMWDDCTLTLDLNGGALQTQYGESYSTYGYLCENSYIMKTYSENYDLTSVTITYNTYDSEFRLPYSYEVTKTNARFVGWNVEAVTENNWGTFRYGGILVEGAWGDVKLVAQWVSSGYVKLLEAETSEEGNPIVGESTIEVDTSKWMEANYSESERSIYYEYDTAIFSLPFKVTRDGYTFVGWKVKETDNEDYWGEPGTIYKVEILKNETFASTRTEEGNFSYVHLIEIWEEIEYTITLNMDGNIDGTGVLDKDYDNSLGFVLTNNVEIGDTTVTAYVAQYTISDIFIYPSAERSGYLLGDAMKAWYVMATDGNWSDDNDSALPGATRIEMWGNVVLDPNWIELDCTIELLKDETRIGESVIENFNAGTYAIYEETNGVRQIKFNSKYGGIIKLPYAEISRAGYNFVGWQDVAALWGDYGEIYTTSSGISVSYGTTLVEVWEPIEYTLTLEFEEDAVIDNKTTATTKEITYTIESNDILLKITRPGHIFSYWYLEVPIDGWTKNVYNPGEPLKEKWGDVTLTAVWDMYIYTISFVDGNAAYNETIFYYDAYIEQSDMVDVVYDKDARQLKYGPYSTFKLPYDEMSRDGYEFKGWEVGTDTTGWAGWLAKGSTYGIKNKNIVFAGYEGDVELIEVWGAREYTVTFEYELGTVVDSIYYKDGSTSMSMSYYIEGDLDKIPNATRDGYIFVGWVPKDKVGGWQEDMYSAGEWFDGKWGDVTLEANWLIKGYTITLIQVGSSVISTSYNTKVASMKDVSYSDRIITYTKESQFYLPSVDEITRDGYTFQGWELTTVDGNWPGIYNTPFSGDELIMDLWGDVTLTELWATTSHKLTLKFEADAKIDGKTTLTTKEITYTIESVDTIPYISRDGYDFVGWTVEGMAYGWTEELYDQEESLTGKWGDVTLEANWTPANYEITLLLDGGTIADGYDPNPDNDTIEYLVRGSDHIITYNNTGIFNLPSFVDINKNGYTFGGWEFVTDKSGENNWLDKYSPPFRSDMYGVWGNVTLQAKWTLNSYTLTLQFEKGAELAGFDSENYEDVDGNVKLKQVSIPYTVEDTFNLPLITLGGSTFSYWEIDEKTESWTTSTYGPQAEISGKWGNVTLTAVWDLDLNTIILKKAESGIGESVIDNYNPGSMATYEETSGVRTIKYTTNQFVLPYTEITRNGYTFKGWTIDAETDVTNLPWDANKTYGNEVLEGLYGNVTLIENWLLTEYKITLQFEKDAVIDNKTTSTTKEISYTIEDDTFNLPTITLAGSTFSYWEIDEVTESWTSSTYGPQAPISGKWGDVVLTAKWNSNGYKIILAQSSEVVEGSVSIIDEEYNPAVIEYRAEAREIYYNKDNKFYLPSVDEIRRDGYIFQGWELTTVDENEGNWPGEYDTLFSGDELITGLWGNVTLTEIWSPKQYTLTLKFESDAILTGYDLGITEATINYTIESDGKIPSISCGGRTFVGWTVLGEAYGWTSASYNQEEPFKGKWGNVTLQAQWGNVDYIITLKQVGSSVISTSYNTKVASMKDVSYSDRKITYNKDSVFNLPYDEITRDGYTFEGWKIDARTDVTNLPWDAGIIYKNEELKGLHGNVTLTEIWTPTQYTLRLRFEPDAVLTGYDSGITETTINYTIESDGKIPSISCGGRKFEGWTVLGEAYGWTSASYNQEEPFKGKWGNVTLQACWEDIDYTITLKQVGSSVISTSYNTKVASMKDVSYSDRQITYNKNSQFYLPYQEISREGYTFLGWTIDPETDITNLPWNAERTYKDELLKILYGNVTLVENWIENTYNIELHSNNGSGNSTLVSGIGYTSVVQLTNTSSGRTVEITGSNAKSVSVEWELAYNGYKFVGWAVAGYDSVQSYGYIDVNFSESNINGNGIEGSLEENLQLNWGTKILKDGCNVSQITLGDSVSSQTVHVYAIWLPVYTLTIDANIPTEVLTKDGAVEGVYFNGSKTNKTSIEINNDYFTDYLLYTQLDSDIFYEPSTTGYRLFYYGYYINGWIIKVGHDTYYEISDDYNPSYEEWLIDLSNTKMVNSGVNMRYLQGNIVATPQWKALTFDVRFVTNSSEDYKSGYEDTYISQVTFNANYVIEENVNVTTESMIVQATDILAYSVIYAHPYNSGVLDETIQITRSGAWAYRLQYKKYDQYDAYEANDGWYIVVEGYYSPDLYRLELNIQLPYTTNNDFKVNANGYTLQTTTLDELQNTYASMIPSNLSGKVEYTNSANYTNRQGKMYQADGKYYIYLLQDQIIENEKVYDRYLDGKNITSPTSAVGKQLPTFEIAYYQMQYYYTFNNESNVNMYQIGELDKEHKENAQNKLTKIGARSISEDPDWKYSYCDTNASAGSPNFKLNVYWYRNIVNVEITNLLDSKDTFNGYTLVTENEQVTGSLQEHAKYHLVIYALTDEVYTYTTYAFDDLSILKTTKYEYAKIKQMFDEKSVEELISLGITKINDRVIPIYFGNAFSVEAIDQSKDHTLDEFIGYRFVNYTYSIADKNGSISTCTSLQEYDNYTNDYVNYIVTVDLKEYEHDEQSNTTNYFSDKDILGIDVNFEKIRYTFIYQVTNADYDVVEKYGKIRFDYQEDVIEASQFDYTVTVNDENTLKSRMQVRLGTELLSWDFVNDYITYDLTDPSSQTIRIIMDAQFLRNYLYRANNPNAYESTPEQNVGDVNAVCQDILFNIQVNVQDVKSGEILTTYILNDEEENPVFTLREEVVQVSIDNIYTIVMLSKQTGDEYIYYYNGEDQYAIRKMYIAPSISKSTKLLETEFGYPVKTLSDISMAVSHELLDGSVNYIQYTEVSEDNRYLNFYVEVAPTYKLTFKVEEDVNDQHKGERQVLVENEAVATGIDGEGLELTAISTYLGYWGQETLFRFVGNDTYYKLAQLNIDYIGQDVDRIVEVETNGNVRYAVNEEAEITIKLIPQTYTITTYIEYQGVRYSINDEYGVNGAIPITELVNASGKQIVSEVTVSPIKGNVDPTKPVYYSGDKLLIEYALNTDIESDYEIALYVNNIKIYTDIIEFVDEDIELKIEVKAETESVTIVTNMPTYEVGDIYAQINNREMIEVNPSSGTELGLINGDQVTIYIKEEVGFEFAGEYEHHKEVVQVTETEGEGEYEGYTKFTMFSGGFELKDNGWYYIQFKQIPIEIEFEYYEEIPDIKPVAAGYGYMATSNTSIIQKGSEITINKGVDAQGYRYQRYTYAGPGDQGINLELTNNSGEDKFIITEEIMQYLSTQEELVLTIYINYVHQYRYQIEYECKPTEVTWNVVDMQGNRLEENDYYDYDTRMNILVESKDSEHYKIEATIITQDENEVIKEGCRPHDIKSEKETNKGHLSGFEVVRDLRSDCTIVIGIDAEEYDTKLYEKLYNGEDDTVENATSLKLQGESQFELTNKIYYEVESSHKYGSEVVVRIYVVNVPEMYDGEQYYKLSKVNLNGRELEVTELDTEGETESVYEIKYILEGSSLPIEQSLEVYFTALYLVRISMRGNS